VSRNSAARVLGTTPAFVFSNRRVVLLLTAQTRGALGRKRLRGLRVFGDDFPTIPLLRQHHVFLIGVCVCERERERERYIYIYMYISVYICTYVYVVCMYVCIYILSMYVNIHTY
jgi:hypothetical protein